MSIGEILGYVFAGVFFLCIFLAAFSKHDSAYLTDYELYGMDADQYEFMMTHTIEEYLEKYPDELAKKLKELSVKKDKYHLDHPSWSHFYKGWYDRNGNWCEEKILK